MVSMAETSGSKDDSAALRGTIPCLLLLGQWAGAAGNIEAACRGFFKEHGDGGQDALERRGARAAAEQGEVDAEQFGSE
jgi:hypothetical protein